MARRGVQRSSAAVATRTVRVLDVTALAVAARDGDTEAFEALVHETYADTYTLAYRLVGNKEDAQDVTQEVYLRVLKGLPRFRADAQFTTWLHRITANTAVTHRTRRAKHRHEQLEAEHSMIDGRVESDPAARADGNDLRRRLESALADLPPRLRAVVVLRDVYDLPHEAIAAELGISETAAKVRLHRARRKLRELVFTEAGHAL